MKLVLLLYLEEDGPLVTRILQDQGISTYSRLLAEGHGEGKPGGLYGDMATHASKMVFSIVDDAKADGLLEAVKDAKTPEGEHPIRAAKLNLEDWVHSAD